MCRLTLITSIACLTLVATGCGPTPEERARLERERQDKAEEEAYAKAHAEREKAKTEKAEKKKLRKDAEQTISACKTKPLELCDAEAIEVVAQYYQNEVNADMRFKGRRIVVKGRISKIGKDILDTPYITIGRFSVATLQCMFKKGDEGDEATLASLHPGQVVFVQGTVRGKMIDVILGDCRLLE